VNTTYTIPGPAHRGSSARTVISRSGWRPSRPVGSATASCAPAPFRTIRTSSRR